jgi:hypothetical protein
MSLTPVQRAEPEALGPGNVRIRLMAAGTNIGASVRGFKTGDMDRGRLGEKHASQVHFDRVVLLAAIVAAITGVLTVAHDYLK